MSVSRVSLAAAALLALCLIAICARRVAAKETYLVAPYLDLGDPGERGSPYALYRARCPPPEFQGNS